MAKLTAHQLGKIIEGVTYKPGWKLQVYEDQFLGPSLWIIAPVQDSYDPDKVIDLGIRSSIPWVESPTQFLDWILHRLIEAEIHEAREFFKIHGEVYSDPHKD